MSGRCWSWWPMVLNPPPHCAPIFPKSSPSRLKKRGFSKDLQCSPQYSWQQSPMQCFPMFQQLSWLARSKYQKNNINQSWCCFTICQIPNFVKDASLAKFLQPPMYFCQKRSTPEFSYKGRQSYFRKGNFQYNFIWRETVNFTWQQRCKFHWSLFEI